MRVVALVIVAVASLPSAAQSEPSPPFCESPTDAVSLSTPSSALVGDVESTGEIALTVGETHAWLEPLLDPPYTRDIVDLSVVLDRGSVRESWTNTPHGLHHTFEVDESTTPDSVDIEIAISGCRRSQHR